jgi:hypothetical protein
LHTYFLNVKEKCPVFTVIYVAPMHQPVLAGKPRDVLWLGLLLNGGVFAINVPQALHRIASVNLLFVLLEKTHHACVLGVNAVGLAEVFLQQVVLRDTI